MPILVTIDYLIGEKVYQFIYVVYLNKFTWEESNSCIWSFL